VLALQIKLYRIRNTPTQCSE